VSDDPPEDTMVPLERLPVPAARCELGGRDGVLTATNERFRTAFDARAGTEIDEWLNEVLVGGSADGVGERLTAGDPVELRVRGDTAADARYYCLRSEVDETGTGTLLVTPTDADGSEVDHLASVVSHDLRNPLDVAKARLEAARETGEPEHFDRLEQAHERMAVIIDDVLTLTRGTGAIDRSPGVDVGAVARAAWAGVETGGATLRVDDTIGTAKADADRLQRLFENLFRNAVEHGTRSETEARDGTDEAAGPTVRLQATSDGFAVCDDGPGIPADERDRVFDPGYTTDGNGTGLGLTIVERIAEAHGWTVRVADGEFGGARFEFEVPREVF